MSATLACRACGSTGVEIFHEQRGIPVNSCLLVDDEETARTFPRGDLVLGWCGSCGFIMNTAFDPELSTYSNRYEETQGFSPRFRAFAADLARTWVERYDLHDKDILEIGCGKGEFIELLCREGGNRGIGIDPSFVPGRVADDADLTFITDFWSPAFAHLPPAADAVVCRHTLEHIAPVGAFMQDLRRAIGSRRDQVVLFELPDVLRVLEEPAFWDLYYEHCSYFSPGSLARLFRRVGLEPEQLWLDFDDQYILIEARPVDITGPATLALEADAERIAAAVDAFPGRFASHVRALETAVHEASEREGGAVIWGAGSKGVSFLTTLGLDGAIDAAVDINPFKQGRYLAGTAHRVVAPKELRDDPPGTVFVMNGVYADEVRASLDELGLAPEIVPL